MTRTFTGLLFLATACAASAGGTDTSTGNTAPGGMTSASGGRGMVSSGAGCGAQCSAGSGVGGAGASATASGGASSSTAGTTGAIGGGSTAGAGSSVAGSGAGGATVINGICDQEPGGLVFYGAGNCKPFNSWGPIKAVDNAASGALDVNVPSQGASGQGFFWTVNANQATTLDATGYGSLQFEIDTDVDVELSLFSGAPVAADQWTDFAWPIPAYLAGGRGEFDTYFIPRGTKRAFTISLSKSMPRMHKNRLRQVQFRVLDPGTVSIKDLKLSPTDGVLPSLAGNKFDPGPNNTYLVIGQEAAGMTSYFSSSMPKPAGLMYYLSATDGAYGWDSWGSAVGEYDAKRFLVDEYATYRNSFAQIGLWLQAGAAGTGCQGIIDSKGLWDTAAKYQTGRFLYLLESRMKLARRPVFLRIGYEFDNPAHSCGSPAQYQEAYRTLVDYFTEKGVDNAAYVWHAYTQVPGDLSAYYPGDDYVDWVGASDFTAPAAQAGYLANNVKKIVEFAKGKGKPVAICESTPMNIASVSTDVMNNWFGNLFDFVEGKEVSGYSAAGQVRMLSYIDSNWPAFSAWQSSAGWSNTLLTGDMQTAFSGNLSAPLNGHRYLTQTDISFDPSDPNTLTVK